MTRANINIKIDPPTRTPLWYYHYHNGDHYVSGIRDWFGFLELLKLKNPAKKDILRHFQKYYGEDFCSKKVILSHLKKGSKQFTTPIKRIGLEILTRPCILYDDAGFLTDYSYIVDFPGDKVLIYYWAKLIFEGTTKEAVKWVKNYE